MNGTSYTESLAAWLRRHADAEAAGPMAAYMRNLFEFPYNRRNRGCKPLVSLKRVK